MTQLDDVLTAAPVFADGVRRVTALHGGLTNTNARVDTADGSYVVRCFSDDTSLLAIDRDVEHTSSMRAAAAGVGAPVVDYLPAQRAMIFGFVEGPTMSAAQLRKGEHIGAIADACRRLHAAERFDADFDMFDVQRRYLGIVDEHGLWLPPGYHDHLTHLPAIREALAVHAGPTVPCHNDLLAENLILSAPGRFTLIDYEYAGNNDAAFELGNLCSESRLSDAQLTQLVTAYFGRPLPHQVARARLWALVAQYGWTLWASIQDARSALDFDFRAWGLERYERARRIFDDTPALTELLADAARVA